MLKPVACLAIALFLPSCKQQGKNADSVLFEEQKEELATIQKELAEVQKKANEANAVPPAVPVVELQEKLEAAKVELEGLNAKYGELEKSHDALIKKLEDYQAKYPLGR
jgi:uncharacterized coiled-coil DUF342 family protein